MILPAAQALFRTVDKGQTLKTAGRCVVNKNMNMNMSMNMNMNMSMNMNMNMSFGLRQTLQSRFGPNELRVRKFQT